MARKQRETERDRQFCSYGFKFEQYMSVDSPGSLPDTRVPVDENEEFCCMFRTRIGRDHGVMYIRGGRLQNFYLFKHGRIMN
jgi:hypothetical protein